MTDPKQAREQEALKWLDEHFGTKSSDEHDGPCLGIDYTEVVPGKYTLFLLDKSDRKWRFSEVLASYTAERDAQIAKLELLLKYANDRLAGFNMVQESLGAAERQVAELRPALTKLYDCTVLINKAEWDEELAAAMNKVEELYLAGVLGEKHG